MAIIRSFRGMTPRIAEDVFLAEDAVIIGDVEIGPGSSIWYGAVLRGDVNAIRIGARTNIQDGTIIHVNSDREGDYRETGGGLPALIGDDVTVGHRALLHACTLESRAFVGMNALVMDRAVVESEAMLAAGALLTPRKRVPRGELWAGSPARFMRRLSEEEQEEILLSAMRYNRLAASYRGEEG